MIMRSMVTDWVPGFGSLVVNPQLNRIWFPNMRFQWMSGKFRNQTHRICNVRPPPPLIPPRITHPIQQPILRQWESTEYVPQISIQDYRFDHDKIQSLRLPDDNPETGWVLGMPHWTCRPQLCQDVKHNRADFWGHFNFKDSTNSKFKKNKTKGSKKGYPILGIVAPKKKSIFEDVDPKDYLLGYKIPPSAEFDYHYDTFLESKEGKDEYKYEKDFGPPVAPSVNDSESCMGIFQEDQQRCGWIYRQLMYCDQKLSYLRDCPPWHRVQIGVPALRIIQAIYTLGYLTTVNKHCLGNESNFCKFQTSTDWRDVIPFFAVYFGISLPIIPGVPVPSILHWYRSFRSINAVLFIIQTMVMAQISTAMYMHKSPATKRIIYEYQYGLICASLFFIAYFRIKYDRQVENMPYWNIFTGCRESKPDYWISTYYGRTDTRGYHMYSSMIRQFHDIFDQARINNPVWMRNHAILYCFALGYYAASSGLFNTLCQISVWLKNVVGFLMFNFALGIGMSSFQLYWMHHLFCQQSLNIYHWGDIFMVALIT